MHRSYPLLRLTPEAAGQLQHDYDRAIAKLNKLEAELAELQRQTRAMLGSEAYLFLRNSTHTALRIAQLKQELAA